MKRVYFFAALFAAVATHRCVDFLVSLGLAPATDRDYAHVAVGPVAVGAIAMFAALIVFALADRDRWFARLVREIESTPLIRALGAVFGLAAIALFGIESLEQMLSFGHLAGAYTWLGTSLPLALSILGVIVAVVVLAIRRGARALVTAMKAIRAYGELFIATRARNFGVLAFSPVRTFVAMPHALESARGRGLRAPPQAA